VALVKVITTKSAGKRSWTVKGGCRISGKNVVAPRKKATCTLKLKISVGRQSRVTSRTIRVP
jgi:hypothetical protein